jgi:hypothetical protein
VNFNNLSVPERRKLLIGPYGRQLLETVKCITAPLYWGDARVGGMPSNGTACFVNTGGSILAVTARHVYDAYEQAMARQGNLVCLEHGSNANPLILDSSHSAGTATWLHLH